MATNQNRRIESSLAEPSIGAPEFPSNSNNRKEREPGDIPPTEGHKSEKIIKGVVKTRKHNLATDISDRFIKFSKDTILPAAKDAAVDMFKRWVDVMVYGEERGRSNRNVDLGGRQFVSYSGYYQQNNRNRRSSRTDFNDVSRNLDDQVFENRPDAEDVLDRLKDELSKFGEVSIAIFFDSIGKTTPFTANKYGWTNLDDAFVSRVNDGWIINFPEPEVLR